MFTSIPFSFDTLTLAKLNFQHSLENKQPCHFSLNPIQVFILSAGVFQPTTTCQYVFTVFITPTYITMVVM